MRPWSQARCSPGSGLFYAGFGVEAIAGRKALRLASRVYSMPRPLGIIPNDPGRVVHRRIGEFHPIVRECVFDSGEAGHPIGMHLGDVCWLRESPPFDQVDDQFGHLNRIVLSPHIEDQNGDAGLEMHDVPDATTRAIRLVGNAVQSQPLACEPATVSLPSSVSISNDVRFHAITMA